MVLITIGLAQCHIPQSASGFRVHRSAKRERCPRHCPGPIKFNRRYFAGIRISPLGIRVRTAAPVQIVRELDAFKYPVRSAQRAGFPIFPRSR